MDEETQKILEKQFASLPENIQTAIVSAEYKTKLKEITDRQRLLIDQAGKLEMETTFVMIGLEPLADYVENLQRELGIDIIRAKELAADVSENIFKPIRSSLYSINEIMESENNEEKTIEEKSLDREQILKEVADPSLVGQGVSIPIPSTEKSSATSNNIVNNKLSEAVVTTPQVIEVAPEVKLPPVEKTRPSSGFDPYREQIQ